MRVRRPEHLFVDLVERREIRVADLLAGRLAPERRSELVARALPAESVVDGGELAVLAAAPHEEWEEAAVVAARAGAAPAVVAALVDRGLLLAREGDDAGRPAQPSDHGWERHAAFFHLATRWRGEREGPPVPLRPGHLQAADPTAGAAFERAIDEQGEPPSPAHRRPDALASLELAPVRGEGGLYEALRRREVTRLFEEGATLAADDLAHLLGWVWGARGTARVSPRVTLLKKTSPSGGGLHPVECYPLVRRVEGLEPGLYHYRAADHRLDLLRPMAGAEVAEGIAALTTGQDYFATSQVAFLLTARFARTFWKYRDHGKAYRVVLFDAGHLSQTLQLVATERGLGAWVTAAINEADVDDLLGLDGVEEGAVLICGCGIPPAAGPGLTLAWETDGRG